MCDGREPVFAKRKPHWDNYFGKGSGGWISARPSRRYPNRHDGARKLSLVASRIANEQLSFQVSNFPALRPFHQNYRGALTRSKTYR
jgi:hypothetical protein